MKKILIFLFLSYSLIFSQVILTESFNNFAFQAHDSTKLLAIFSNYYHTNESTGKTVVEDLSGNQNNLSIGGWVDINALLTNMQSGNPYYYNGNSLYFPGDSQFVYIPAVDAGALNPGVGGSFTIEAWIKPVSGVSLYIASKSKNGGNYDGYNFYYSDYNKLALWTSNGTVFGSTSYSNTLTLADGNWHYVAVNFNSGNVTFYADGIQVGSATGAYDAVNTTDNFRIQKTGGGTIGKGGISIVSYTSRTLSLKEINESYALAYGWLSNNGNIFRVATTWYQGIIGDTIYTAIPNSTIPANRQAVLSFDAWGQNGGEVIKPYTLNWDGGQSITVTNQKKKYTVYLGQMDFSSDSLYFAVPAAADTVYIDNVKLEYKHIKKQTVWDLWQ